MTGYKIGVDLASGKDRTEIMILEKKDKDGEFVWEPNDGEFVWEPNWEEIKKVREDLEFIKKFREHLYEYYFGIPKDKYDR